MLFKELTKYDTMFSKLTINVLLITHSVDPTVRGQGYINAEVQTVVFTKALELSKICQITHFASSGRLLLTNKHQFLK